MKKILIILLSIFVGILNAAPPKTYNYAVTYEDSVKSEMIVARDSMCINGIWFTTDDFGSGGGLDSLEVKAIVNSSIVNYNDTSGVEISEVTFDILQMDTAKIGDFYLIADEDSLWVANPANTWQSRLDSIVGGGSSELDTTITLLDNTTGGNINIGQVGYFYFWNYKILRGANARCGQMSVTGLGTTIGYNKGDYYPIGADIGVTINSFNISSGQIRINYTTTNTGSNATMTLTRLSKL